MAQAQFANPLAAFQKRSDPNADNGIRKSTREARIKSFIQAQADAAADKRQDSENTTSRLNNSDPLGLVLGDGMLGKRMI